MVKNTDDKETNQDQISFRIDKDLKKQFEKKLIDNGETATSVLRDAVAKYTESSRKGSTALPETDEQMIREFLKLKTNDELVLALRVAMRKVFTKSKRT